jgi:hypothetical protein
MLAHGEQFRLLIAEQRFYLSDFLESAKDYSENKSTFG